VAEIYLVRHGETVANVAHRFDSTLPGAPLTERGQRQAQLVAQWFSERDIFLDFLLSSPFRRTRQTAAPLHAATARPVLLCDLLREVDLGSWDGHPSEEFRNDQTFLRWLRDPEVAPPGGERLSDVTARLGLVLEAVERLAPAATCALFSHELMLCASLVLCGQGRDATGHLVHLPNASVVHLHRRNGLLEMRCLDRSISSIEGLGRAAI